MMVSVIVPIYNVAKYLARGIDSLLKQTYTDFELILIDDGSTDGSGMICDEYQEKDSRVTVIHKENGGVSSARNAGLDVAKGKYIYFFDPDDYAETNLLEVAVSAMEDSGAQLCVFGYQRDFYVSDIMNGFEEKKDAPSGFFKPIASILTQLHKNTLLFSLWNKVFCNGIIQSRNIRFIPIPKYEDASFIYEYLMYTTALVTWMQCLYHYSIFISGTKTATTKFDPKLFDSYYTCYLKGKELIENLGQRSEENPKQVQLMNQRIEEHFAASYYGDFVINLSRSGYSWRERMKYVSNLINAAQDIPIADMQSLGRVDRVIHLCAKNKCKRGLALMSYFYQVKH